MDNLFRSGLVAAFASFAALVSGQALVLDFQYGKNADLEGGTKPGPHNMGTNTVTLSNIPAGDGSFIGLTVVSSPTNINSADQGIGVDGNDSTRLGIGEIVKMTFTRDVTLTGYLLNQFTAGENLTIVTPNSGGTIVRTTATVSDLSLPLAAGETVTFSTTAGDGVRLGSITVAIPLVGDDTFTVSGNSKIAPLPVLANDPGTGLTLTAVSRPIHGVAAVSGTNVIYTPVTGYVGSDTFTYTSRNSSGVTSTLSVAVNVTAPAPEAANDKFQVLRNTRNNPLSVLRNDPGSSLGIISMTAPAHGNVTVNGANILYTPTEGYIGPDSFTYTTQDGVGTNEVRTVTMDVRQYPNFVILLADDQGWTGTSVQMDKTRPNSKSDYYRTPRIEGLAADGMRFSRAYSSAPNCSPSRYALLTGKTCARLKMTDIVDRNDTPTSGKFKLIAPGKAVNAIQASDITTAELLKAIPGAGYSAAHFGKWHIAGGGPTPHGFDADANDGQTGNAMGDTGTAPFNEDAKRSYSITDRSILYLDTRVASATPFYLQVSHYAVHETTQTTQASYDAFNGVPKGAIHNNQYYAGMTLDLDKNVGRVLDELDDLGIRNSTYVIYTADNGAPQDQSENAPLRGYKPEVWEGGTRVPTFMRGPGVVADSQCDVPVIGIDILPTIDELATGSLTNLPVNVDGGSIVPVIRNMALGLTPPDVSRQGELVHHAPHYVGPLPWPDDWQLNAKDARPRSAIHVGRYKLVANYESGAIELYDLEGDIGELNNLSDTQLAIKWQLWVRLRDYLKLINAQMPTLDPTYKGTNHGDFVLAASTGPLGDADSDGLNDDWEMRELLTYRFNGSEDPDHDGVTTAQELALGTDPLLPDAYRIDSITHIPPNQIKITYNSTPGAKFVVETSTDLVNWTPAQTVTTGDEFQGIAIVVSDNPREFFRVRKL
jgi:arylsulfatase A-like enzyme